MRSFTLLMIAALGLSGCEAFESRAAEKRRWMSSSRKACKATAVLLKGLRRELAAFEKVFDTEQDKTRQGRRPLRHYNPHFLKRLQAALHPLDLERGPRADRLARDVWTTHYRFVKEADEVLPRLHRFLVLLAELRSTVSVARRLEKHYGHLLVKQAASYKAPKPDPTLRYGVRISSDRKAVFLRKAPQPRATPDKKPPGCVPVQGTNRVFAPDDVELMNRAQCRGRDKIVYTAHLYHLMQIKLILAKIGKLDLRGLTVAFRRSAE